MMSYSTTLNIGESMPPGTGSQASSKPRLRCRTSGQFAQWVAESGGSLAITTYNSGKLVLVSSIDGRLRFRTSNFPRPMGIAATPTKMAIAVRHQILLFHRNSTECDSFAQRRTFETGKVDTHDVAFSERYIFFANTRFNCIARVSRKKRFVPLWQPPFVEGVVRGDRCHLNGLGMREDRPTIATAFCATGHAGGWREQNRFTGGVVIDIQRNEIVASDLCMPHSPRWHNGRWWLCNSGHGHLSVLDYEKGNCQEVCRLPGFTRGLSLVGSHALVGLSKIRRKHVLDAPPVRERCENISAGVALVNLTSGNQIGRLEFVEGGNEVYEVLFLPGIRKPHLTLTKTTESEL